MRHKGFYRVQLEDGEILVAWYNPFTGHWLNEEQNKEIGFGDTVNGKGIKSVFSVS